MPKKPQHTKGRYPKPPKTKRKDQPLERRAAIARNIGITTGPEEVKH